MKSKIGKFGPVLLISKLSDVVKNDAFKKDFYNAKIKNIEGKIPGISNLTNNTAAIFKINEVKKERPSITNLAITTDLTAGERQIPNVSNLVQKNGYNTKISEIENKVTTDHDHYKYITTQEFDKLTSENFFARLKQANLVSKSDTANFFKKVRFW